LSDRFYLIVILSKYILYLEAIDLEILTTISYKFKQYSNLRATIILYLSLIVQVLTVQSQEFNWATSVSGYDYEYGVKNIKDASGNTYLIGHTTGSSFEIGRA